MPFTVSPSLFSLTNPLFHFPSQSCYISGPLLLSPSQVGQWVNNDCYLRCPSDFWMDNVWQPIEPNISSWVKTKMKTPQGPNQMREDDSPNLRGLGFSADPSGIDTAAMTYAALHSWPGGALCLEEVRDINLEYKTEKWSYWDTLWLNILVIRAYSPLSYRVFRPATPNQLLGYLFG